MEKIANPMKDRKKEEEKKKATLQTCVQGLWFVYSSLQSIILLGKWEFDNMGKAVGNISFILEVLTQHNRLSTTLIQQNTCVYFFLSSS